MQYRPDAAELLSDIAALLDEVVTELAGPLQHRARVAANLARIVEREIRLGPPADEAERRRLALLLGEPERPLNLLRATLAERLGSGGLDDKAVYDALLATIRDDLSITKPGYDDWVGQ